MSKVDVGIKHNHNRPFVSTCPACKLVCLMCIGQMWEFYVESESGPVQVGNCSWCKGTGLRSEYNRTSKKLSQQLSKTVSPAEPGKNATTGHLLEGELK